MRKADRSVFAWEWLRRDRSYCEAAARSLGASAGAGGPGRAWSREAERWGLHAFERPSLPAPFARPVWTGEAHPAVLAAVAHASGSAADLFRLDRFADASTVVAAPGRREHLLISDGLRSIRLDILSGTATLGPVRLHYRIGGLEAAEKPLMTLRRLLVLWRTGRFSNQLHRPEAKAIRWIWMLRAHDALAAGADQRAIAEALLGGEAGEPRWRSEVPSLRSRAQRLVRSARRMAAGGYRELLR